MSHDLRRSVGLRRQTPTQNSERKVHSIDPAIPEYLQWSEAPITFDRSGHPDKVPCPGTYPLVVEPIVGSKCLTRVLMDGGSGLNIMYVEILDALGNPRTSLRPSHAPFHGIIPGQQAYPLGQITLPVTFGDPSNFYTEQL